MDKRLWIMTLMRYLLNQNENSNLSYENLIGNFRDGAIGSKLRTHILNQFFETIGFE